TPIRAKRYVIGKKSGSSAKIIQPLGPGFIIEYRRLRMYLAVVILMAITPIVLSSELICRQGEKRSKSQHYLKTIRFCAMRIPDELGSSKAEGWSSTRHTTFCFSN